MLGCINSKVIGTDTLLESKQVTLGEHVHFGNDGNGVSTCTAMLHDRNVGQLETKIGLVET